MKRMLKSVLLVFYAALVGTVFLGCSSDDYDDTAIKEQISDLDSRVSALEQTVKSANQEITQIKVLINNLEKRISIKNYVAIENGYRIVFTDGSSIDIKNGINSGDVEIPIIGVSLERDGHYYWTVTINGVTTFLLDDKGNKLSVTGKDGVNGKDGVTPIIKVDASGYWIISYDNGRTFVYVEDTDGKKVSALGEKGSGESTSYITKTYQYDSYIVFVLYNGKEIRMPIYKGLGITLKSKEIQFVNNANEVSVSYTVTGSDNYTFVETIDKGNVKSTVVSSSISGGTIKIKKTGDIDKDTKVLVLLCNRDQTVTTVITVTAQIDNRIDDVVPKDIQEKLKNYIEIYRGVNPPNVEGAYFIDPFVTVYCEDQGNGGYDPGDIVMSMDARFYNQDIRNNIINYEAYSGSSHEVGTGAFISGSGNYFTIFFNTVGVSSGISTKTALVISGEKTSSGIKNLRYAFILVDKGSDPSNKLMKKGVFRVFEDGDKLAKKTNWTHGYSSAKKMTKSNESGLSIFSNVR